MSKTRLKTVTSPNHVWAFSPYLGQVHEFADRVTRERNQLDSEGEVIEFCVAKFARLLVSGNMPIKLISQFFECVISEFDGKTAFDSKEAVSVMIEEIGLELATLHAIDLISIVLLGTVRKKREAHRNKWARHTVLTFIKLKTSISKSVAVLKIIILRVWPILKPALALIMKLSKTFQGKAKLKN